MFAVLCFKLMVYFLYVSTDDVVWFFYFKKIAPQRNIVLHHMFIRDGISTMSTFTLYNWELPGGLVVTTLPFYCRGHRFNSWSGNKIPHVALCAPIPAPPEKIVVVYITRFLSFMFMCVCVSPSPTFGN